MSSSEPRLKPNNQVPPATETPEEKGTGAEALLEQTIKATEDTLAKTSVPLQKPIGFHPAEISALINTEVVARYIDEAPFLWQMRDRAVNAPHYSLRDLAEVDERVEAQLDGLRVAGDYGWRLVEKSLEMGEPGEVFMAGVLALERGDPQCLGKVTKIACKKKQLQRALISAAGWVPFEAIEKTLQKWIDADNPGLRRIAVGAYAIHRCDPGQTLVHRLYDDHPAVHSRAIKAVGELGRVNLLPMVLNSLKDKDSQCRFYAAWAAALLGDRSTPVMEILRATVLKTGPFQERALALAIRCMNSVEALDWLRSLWKDPARLRLAAIGAGALGDPALVGVLIELMEIESVARVAGEAFALITGADLDFLDLVRDPDDPPEDDPLGGPTFEVLQSDEDVPIPAPQLIADWWRANQENYTPGKRYVCGRPADPTGLCESLRKSKQRQRAAAALELALLCPGKPLFNIRARGQLQEKELRTWIS